MKYLKYLLKISAIKNGFYFLRRFLNAADAATAFESCCWQSLFFYLFSCLAWITNAQLWGFLSALHAWENSFGIVLTCVGRFLIAVYWQRSFVTHAFGQANAKRVSCGTHAVFCFFFISFWYILSLISFLYTITFNMSLLSLHFYD